MILVVAEKPKIARYIADVLGADKKGQGFLYNSRYTITWCHGHLIAIPFPGEMNPDWKKWNLVSLPIIPEPFKYSIMPDAKAQFGIIKRLMNEPNTEYIICATDADREGQAIFENAYRFAKCKKPVKRMWINSITPQGLRSSLRDLRDNRQYKTLYFAALCRNQADWLVGINATRLFSILYNVILPIGRVETPVLALIVNRQAEIDHFISQKYYEIEADFPGFKSLWFNDDGFAISEKEKAQEIAGRCSNQPGKITDLDRTKKEINRPQLFELNTLQIAANQLYGFTADQTLSLLQSLYETHKLATYPRTDCPYITSDMAAVLPKLLEDIAIGIPNAAATVSHLLGNGLNLGKHIVDDKKTTNHPAILVTGEIKRVQNKKLSDDETKLLFLIVARTLCALDQPIVYDETKIVIEIGKDRFKATGKRIISPGWAETAQTLMNRKFGIQSQEIPNLTKGQSIQPNQVIVLDKTTTSSKPYTDGTLLQAMENAGKKIQDADLKDSMKSIGLGTRATRSKVIEKLVKYEYVNRKNKTLIPTEKGKNLIAVVPDILKLPDMTAAWEQKLEDIYQHNGDSKQFMIEIRDFVRQLIDSCSTKRSNLVHFEAAGALTGKEIIGKCPRCGKPIYEGSKNYYCSGYKDDPKCSFVIWKDSKWLAAKGKKLTKAMVKSMLEKGSVRVSGLKAKNGSTYNACLSLVDTGTYVDYKLELIHYGKKSNIASKKV